MNTERTKIQYVRVNDAVGNTFVCPIDALKDVNHLTEEELGECVDDGLLGRYAGNIDIIDRASIEHLG